MIRAILFDKDGTFTDFRKTWEAWMPTAIRALAAEAGVSAVAVAEVIGVDLQSGRIRPDGRFVTATNAETAAMLGPVLGWSATDVLDWWRPRVVAVPQVEVTPLAPYLTGLRDRGLCLGVLTNADEGEARKHLAELGALPYLDRVIGCDSGFGAKPDPAGAADFAKALGLEPRTVVVVGDGLTDMRAAAGAGMRAVAVMTGTQDAQALAPHAEVVLRDIEALPAWLDRNGG
ncbi:MAG: HAD family hydrolase [Jannaschia sp.]